MSHMSVQAPATFGATFGGTLAGVPVCGSSRPPTVLLNHSLSDTESHAVLHHFWTTGTDLLIDRAIIEYRIDGEATPSIVFTPSMACGHAFPQHMPHDKEYAAGALCGKTAPTGGWWHTFPIPMYRSVSITARADPADGPGCFSGFFNVRGTPGLPITLPASGLTLPLGSRLSTIHRPLALRQPLEFVAVASMPAGSRGMLFQATLAVEAAPVGGVSKGSGYIEGCWNFYRQAHEPFPGLVVGTGVEDYFDSGYYFGADAGDKLGTTYANPLAGLVHFERDEASGIERLSAYRFHGSDPLVWSDGGKLSWRVGASHLNPSKCVLEDEGEGDEGRGDNTTATADEGDGAGGGHGAPPGRLRHRYLTAVNVTTLAWMYTFPAAAEE